MPRVLFVDDEPHVTEGLKRALRMEPFQVVTASSAEEALEILAQQPADVIVADEKMPGMSGTEFLAVARREYPDSIRIVLTGYASLEAAIRAVNEGEVYRFFTKPCLDVDLAVTIKQALEQRELMIKAQQLLGVAKSQSEELSRLERQHPGITQITRDQDGAILLQAPPMQMDELLAEIKKLTERLPKE